MSKRRRRNLQEELPLFDFPLDGGDGESAEAPDREIEPSAEPRPEAAAAAPNLHLVPPAPAAEETPSARRRDEPPRDVTLDQRALAGVIDLGIHAAVLGAVFLGVHLLGVRPTPASWPPFSILALVFSFLYCVVPLAFWGQTPGMIWTRQIAHSDDGEPLSFGQTSLRWLGDLATIALAGLPLLLALAGGRSLADRLSGSEISPA